MPYETLRMDEGSEFITSDFQAAIFQQIANHGDENHPQPDRYRPQDTPARDYDYQYNGQTGDIKFGDTWLTHRLDIGNLQLIYAFQQPRTYRVDEVSKFLAEIAGEEPTHEDDTVQPVKAEFYVHEFGDRGLQARTEFSEHEGDIYKSRITLFATVAGLGLTELSRRVKKREQRDLETVITEPEAHEVALRGLIKLTAADKLTVKRALKEHEQREREHLEHLEAINRAIIRPIMPAIRR